MTRHTATTTPARAGRDTVVDVAMVLLLGVVALLGFATVFDGSTYLVRALIGLVLGVLVGWLGARRRWGVPLTVLVAAVAALLTSGLVLPSTAIAGVLPSPQSLVAFARGAVEAWVGLLTTVPRVDSTSSLVVVPYLTGMAAGFASTQLARRTRSVSAPLWPLLAAMVVGILWGVKQPAALLVQGTAFAVLGLLWTSIRGRRADVRPAGRGLGSLLLALLLLVVATGSAAALVLGADLAGARDRYVLRDEFVLDFDPRAYPSPLNGFREYREDPAKTATLLTVAGLPEETLVPLATMDYYDGQVWNVAGGVGDAEGTSSGIFEKVGTDYALGGNQGGAAAQVEVRVGDLEGVWLPLPGRLDGITFTGERSADLADSFRYNRATGTAATPLGVSNGDGYDARVILRPAVAEPGEECPAGDLEPDPSIVLPEVAVDIEAVRTLAADFTSQVAGACEKAQTLAATLREGYYSDGIDDARPLRPGHGANRMTEFLADPDRLNGNDEQYASAMALMARSIGLPARVVLGFAPQRDGVVTGDQATAWVEVAFEDAGWVVFRPTPDRDRVLPDEQPEPTPRPQPVAQPPPPPPPQVEQQPETKQQDVDDDQDKADEASALPAWVGRVALGVGIPLLLVGLYAGVVLGLKARRRARRRGRPRPADRVSGGWDELTDLAADLGRPASPLATRRENAAALGGGSVAMLAREADAATFGPREVDDAEAADFWALVESTSSEMRAPLTRRQRMRARLGLRSLRSRRSRRGGV